MRTTSTRGKLTLLFMAFAVLLALPAMAFADTFAVDGTDGFDTSNSKNSKFVLCQGVGSSVNVDANFNYSGSTHFKNGEVKVTTSVEQAAQGFITAAGGSITLKGWDDSRDKASIQDMKLTVGDNWTAGTFKVTYKATDGTLVLEDTNNVQISAATTGCSTDGGGTDGGSTPPPPALNTAPTVDVTGVVDGETYEIGAVPAAGCSVVDAEDTDESATPQVSAISGALSAYGLGLQTVTCSYSDGGGLSGSDTATYTIADRGAPTITDRGATSLPDGQNNWYVSAVTNVFRASDSGAGFPTDTPKLLSYDFNQSSGAAEGSAVTINSGSVSDVAGNPATAIDSAAHKIDLSDPVLNVSGAASGASNVCAGLPVRPSFAPRDAISGLDGSERDSWTTPNAASGVGSYVYKADAKDVASRSASETRTYTVNYGNAANGGAYDGVLAPINRDGSSNFKLGSTVPVKFKLMCSSGSIANAVSHISVKNAGSAGGDVNENISTAAPHDGTQFRYDATNQQYIFNLSTKSLSAGKWNVTITMDDGSSRSASFDLRK